MGTQTFSLNLLNRTKYAQNRTKYYCVRNTVLSQTERPFFVCGSFHDPSNNRKLLSLKKSFLNRRSSKRGPFQKLSLPHEYFKTFGDPLYYSPQDLVSVCVSASSENLSDSYFWKQICEKIREVRDLIPINDLLSCLSSVSKVNYYDSDLLRVLSPEFVQDMSKLSLDEISQLLDCYYKQNVYSCDLVNSAGSRVSEMLATGLEDLSNQVTDSETTGFFGKLKDSFSANSSPETNFGFRPLSRICKHLNYFNYSNPSFYLSLSNLFLSNFKNMDFVSRLEMFRYLDPKFMSNSLVKSSKDSHKGSSESDVSADNSLNGIISGLLDSMEFIDPSSVYHENSYDLSTFFSSHLFRDSETSKLVYEFCSTCSTHQLVSKAVFRFLSNCVHLNSGCPDSINSLLTVLSNLSEGLLPLMSKIAPLDSGLSAKSPFVSSLQHIFMDSILTSLRALNSYWRLKTGCFNPTSTDVYKQLSFTLEDDNVHSSFLKSFNSLLFSESEVRILSSVLTSLNLYGSRGQSVRNITTAFESLVCLLVNRSSVSLPSSLFSLASNSLTPLSHEISRQLVDFDRESLYRVSLSLSVLGRDDLHLTHYLRAFPKITRLSTRKHHLTFSDPFSLNS